MAGIGHVTASHIRAERARRRMSQADLAPAIGWPRSSIHDVEAGRRKISPGDLVALCRTFGITPHRTRLRRQPRRPADTRHLS